MIYFGKIDLAVFCEMSVLNSKKWYRKNYPMNCQDVNDSLLK